MVQQLQELVRGPGDGARDDDEAAAVQQGAPHLPDGEVEGVGVEEGPDVVGAEGVLGGGVEETGEVAAGDDDALGAAGGARGVDEVGGVVLAGRSGAFGVGDRPVRLPPPTPGVGLLVEDEHGGGTGDGGAADRRGVGEDEGGGGVLEGPGDAVLGVGGVDGDVGGSGLGDGDDRFDEHRGAGQQQGDPVLGADPVRHQQARRRVGAGVEFGVREGVVAVGEGRGVGVVDGGAGEPVEDGGGAPVVAGRVPVAQEGVLLPLGEEADGADEGVGAGDRAGQEGHQPVGERPDGGGVEEVGAVVDRPVDGAVGEVVGEADDEVELGGVRLPQGERGVETGRGERDRGAVLVRQHHLEQRVGRPAFGVELLHDPLEGQFGVVEGVEVHRPDPAEEFAESRVSRQVGTQDERVDEEADQLFRTPLAPAGGRDAERDVVPGPESGEQGAQCGLGHHERGNSGARGQGTQIGCGLLGEGEGDESALPRGCFGPGPVGGQVEDGGCAAQGPPPEVGLAPEVVAVQEGVLPVGVVRVGDAERRQVRGPSGEPGPVGGGQVGEQRFDGPFVGRDVVDQQEDGRPVRFGQDGGAEGRFGGEVEGFDAEHAEQLLGLLRALGGPEADRCGPVQDVLDRLPVGLGEDGAQHGVPFGEVADRGGQGVVVDLAGEGQDEGQVVGGAGPEPAQEPQPRLGGRERQRPFVASGFECGQRGVRGRRPGGERGDGRGVEDLADGERPAEDVCGPPRQSGGEQGVAAEGEEVCFRAHLFEAQEVGEERGEQFLALSGRGASDGCGGGPGRGEGGAVELAVRGEREGVERQTEVRDEVAGEHGAQFLADPGGGGGPGPGGTGEPGEVGHQPGTGS
ncbi:hypothetical protein SPW_6617 [Streptomyces sp. W007]|nr:hypothetical protein SPW_6617 [Streptomyces sp. W007]